MKQGKKFKHKESPALLKIILIWLVLGKKSNWIPSGTFLLMLPLIPLVSWWQDNWSIPMQQSSLGTLKRKEENILQQRIPSSIKNYTYLVIGPLKNRASIHPSQTVKTQCTYFINLNQVKTESAGMHLHYCTAYAVLHL